MLMNNLGKQCRDVPWHVWKLGELGEMGELRKLGEKICNQQ